MYSTGYKAGKAVRGIGGFVAGGIKGAAGMFGNIGKAWENMKKNKTIAEKDEQMANPQSREDVRQNAINSGLNMPELSDSTAGQSEVDRLSNEARVKGMADEYRYKDWEGGKWNQKENDERLRTMHREQQGINMPKDSSGGPDPDPDATFGGSATDWANNQQSQGQDMMNLGNTSGELQLRGRPESNAPQKVEGQEMKQNWWQKAMGNVKQGINDRKVKKWQEGKGAQANQEVDYNIEQDRRKDMRDNAYQNQGAFHNYYKTDYDSRKDASEPSNVWSQAGSGQPNDPYVNTGVDTKSWTDSHDPSITPTTPPESDEDPNLPTDSLVNPAADISQGKIGRDEYTRQVNQRLEESNFNPESIPDSVIQKITQIESGGASADSLAASFKSEGAVGPMQQRQIFQDEIARLDPGMKGYDPNDPVQAGKAAKIYIAHQMKTGLTFDQAIMSYNAGRSGAKKGAGKDYLNKFKSTGNSAHVSGSPVFQAYNNTKTEDWSKTSKGYK
jgi:hypothetical protein